MILAHMDDCVSTMANVDVIFAWFYVKIKNLSRFCSNHLSWKHNASFNYSTHCF